MKVFAHTVVWYDERYDMDFDKKTNNIDVLNLHVVESF